MIDLIVRPAAEGDIQDAQTWYSRRDEAVAGRFIEELRATLHRIREMPRQFPDVGGTKRALLHRFSHAVYFLLPDDTRAIVVAILHQSRTPVAWKKRVGGAGAG